ncbi:MAG: 50S ribosomal protein L25/general stress protein Ctc [Microbacterium pygmaeum]|uniref:Large ribosomal subunit protein bL25 n=1 Tax=Microbacterium pygmaeum TaxID=370764 RepID=A0A1G7Z383_9MICO|nr:50S ribosomal protein L25/general stress protein Ctc [Microbacterium pygmaeum]SDH03077.1 LSU ribosomal protein L25P [Microbacterium pygmaeum]
MAAATKTADTESDTKVHAELRENFGKGFARRLRAAGKIPAVIYGHGTEPVHVALPGHQVALLIRRANVVLELDVNGTERLTLVKDVQKDPVHQIIEHIDLLVVRKGEKVQVDVPVTAVGESAAGTIVAQDANTVLLEVEATHIPERIEVSIEGLEEGTHITAADLVLPQGAALAVDPETLIIAISAPSSDADEIAEADAAVAAEQAEESEETKEADAE